MHVGTAEQVMMGSILPSKVSIDHECHAQSIRESAAAQLGRFQIFQRAPSAMQGMQEQRTRARPRPTMRVQLQAACSGQTGRSAANRSQRRRALVLPLGKTRGATKSCGHEGCVRDVSRLLKGRLRLGDVLGELIIQPHVWRLNHGARAFLTRRR
jgi:hypothetical protein